MPRVPWSPDWKVVPSLLPITSSKRFSCCLLQDPSSFKADATHCAYHLPVPFYHCLPATRSHRSALPGTLFPSRPTSAVILGDLDMHVMTHQTPATRPSRLHRCTPVELQHRLPSAFLCPSDTPPLSGQGRLPATRLPHSPLLSSQRHLSPRLDFRVCCHVPS